MSGEINCSFVCVKCQKFAQESSSDDRLVCVKCEQNPKPKSEGQMRDEYYLSRPMDSDPQTIRAHMWMME